MATAPTRTFEFTTALAAGRELDDERFHPACDRERMPQQLEADPVNRASWPTR